MNEKEIQQKLRQGYRIKYGILWEPLILGKQAIPRPDWCVERDLYLKPEQYKFSKEYLGQAEHFCRYLTCLLAHEKCRVPFEINPNTRRIIDEYFKWDFLGVAGHGSSSKSETIAAIAIGEFIAAPEDTGVLVTSTTLAEARGRIWGRIEYLWQDVCDFFGGEEFTPGELVSSSGLIRLKMDGRKDDTKGIKLVPGKESEVREGIGRMKGFKAPRMRFFADELSDLSHKLVEAAESNLYINKDFKMAAPFNPGRHSDPAGMFSEPKDGWESVNVIEADGWETKRGYCIRFDGETSPNVVAGYEKWKGLLTREKLENRREKLGNNSPRFMEQYRGAWSLTGHADCIYSEAEIERCFGKKKAIWLDTPKKCLGFDPAWTHDGDRAPAVILNVGLAKSFDGSALMTAEVDSVHFLDDDLDTSRDRKELIVERLITLAKAERIPPNLVGMDATGGGDVLASWIATQWSNEILRIQFGGKASEKPVSKTNKLDAEDRFANKVSEIWYVGRDLLKAGQLRGLRPAMVVEMTNRLYSQSGSPPKIRVEKKSDMKLRTNGASPDISDALFVALDVARQRMKLVSALAPVSNKRPEPKTFLDQFFESNPLPKKTRRKPTQRWEALEQESGMVKW
jgi:hypothetical protein